MRLGLVDVDDVSRSALGRFGYARTAVV